MSDESRSEYLIVVQSWGDGESYSGQRYHSLRCNRKETAEAIAEWINKSSETSAKVFSDPPKIGQFNT